MMRKLAGVGLLLLILVLLVGSVPQADSTVAADSESGHVLQARTTVAAEPESLQAKSGRLKPPALQVSIGDDTFAAAPGSYHWQSEGHGVFADAASMGPSIDPRQKPVAAVSGDTVDLAFSSSPSADSIVVVLWDNGPSKENKLMKIQDNQFRLADIEGSQLYLVEARWPQGSSTYSFAVQVANKKLE